MFIIHKYKIHTLIKILVFRGQNCLKVIIDLDAFMYINTMLSLCLSLPTQKNDDIHNNLGLRDSPSISEYQMHHAI